MRKPNNLIREISIKEFKDLSLPRAIPRAYLVNQCRGRAYLKQGFVTIPKWAEAKGKDYFLWYVAHELSHILARTKYHDFSFYKIFMMTCPEKLQHYELHYKPTAAKFGIKK